MAFLLCIAAAALVASTATAAPLQLRYDFFSTNAGGCNGAVQSSQTRPLNSCFRSQDNQFGLLFSCVKAGNNQPMLELVCRNDFSCSGNTAGGACSVTQLRSGNCVFSSTSNRYVRISCVSATVTPTLATGGGRQLRSDADAAHGEVESASVNEENDNMEMDTKLLSSEPFDWAVAMESGGLVL